MSFETFPKAPIQEAVLDIFASLPDGTTLDTLKSFQEILGPGFPNKKEKVEISAKLKFPPSGNPIAESHNRTIGGFLFYSEDSKLIVQGRLNGFSFNMLSPYSSWSDFSNQAQIHWDQFAKITNPTKVLRIGLRYVNRIEIPLPIPELTEFFATFPNFDPIQFPSISNLFLKFTAPQPQDFVSAVTLAFDDIVEADQTLPVLLDIHVSKPMNAGDDLWQNFQVARNLKNDVFWSMLTEKTRSLFR